MEKVKLQKAIFWLKIIKQKNRYKLAIKALRVRTILFPQYFNLHKPTFCNRYPKSTSKQSA